MKCKHITSFALAALFLLSFALCGCGSMKRTKTITLTKTVIRIDTVIKVHWDTVAIVRSVPITDTVLIENKTSVARSYYNVKTQKITLELTGKMFGVPVSINSIVKERKKEVTTKGQPFYFWLLTGGFIVTILFLLLKHFMK